MVNKQTSQRVIKSVTQQIKANQDLVQMMKIFKDMVNHCIRIGLENDCCTLKRLSLLAYHELNQYDIMSSYKLNAISQACGRLSQMKKSVRRGIKTKSPYVGKPYITNCYGFKINGCLLSIPCKFHHPFNILLNSHMVEKISELKVKSFVITPTSLSLSVQKEVKVMMPEDVVGIDRNLRNITVGNHKKVTFYKTNKLLSIKENTSRVLSTFRRNDHRIRKEIAAKLGRRKTTRTKQYLHKISKHIVQNAKKSKSMIIFENIKGIRKLYRKGNHQGRKFRRKLNSWPFYELQRQIQYKAAWEEVPVKFVGPRSTSKLCPRCGKRIQEDRLSHRKLWCGNCMVLMDRDVVASLNIAYKGWTRFIHPRGDTGEAMVQEPGLITKEPVILKVDVSKLGLLPKT